MAAQPDNNYEYERRWLVDDLSVLEGHRPTLISQAYLLTKDGGTVRVRRSYAFGPRRPSDTYEGHNTLAIKGPRAEGRRLEIEEEIEPDRAKALFQQGLYRVFKSRFHLVEGDFVWDVDVFHADNEGLAIAECETQSAHVAITRPDWCGRDVTDDTRYNNEQLAMSPYKEWADEDEEGDD